MSHAERPASTAVLPNPLSFSESICALEPVLASQAADETVLAGLRPGDTEGAERMLAAVALSADRLLRQVEQALSIPGIYAAEIDISAPALAAALPLTPDAAGEFHEGWEVGTAEGGVEGLQAIGATLLWIRDAFFGILVAAFDSEFGERVRDQLARDMLEGRDFSDSNAWKFVEERYPALYDIWNVVRTFLSLDDAFKKFETSAKEIGLLDALVEANVKVSILLAEVAEGTLESVLQQFIALRGKPFEQGKYLGKLWGRAAFEIALEVICDLLQPEALLKNLRLLRVGKQTRLAASTLREGSTALELGTEVVKGIDAAAPAIRKRFSLKRALAAGATLERAMTEAFHDLGHWDRYGSLHYRCGLVNKLYPDLQKLQGLSGDAIEKITITAHHVIEERMFRDLQDIPEFAKAFDILGWKSERDMHAVAFFSDFHLASGGSRLDRARLLTDIARIETKDLSAALIESIGEPKSYKTMESLIEAYERFYQPHDVVLKDGRRVMLPPAMWRKVEDALKDVRRRLGLPIPQPPYSAG